MKMPKIQRKDDAPRMSYREMAGYSKKLAQLFKRADWELMTPSEQRDAVLEAFRFYDHIVSEILSDTLNGTLERMPRPKSGERHYRIK